MAGCRQSKRQVNDAMKFAVCILLLVQSAAVVAAEKIPLNAFLADLRDRLHAIDRMDSREQGRAVISNIHVEMNVVAETDQQGQVQYFVLDGLIDKNDVVTQKISFDMQLYPDGSVAADRPDGRVYSTRKRDHRYGPNRSRPADPYLPYRGHYMPDIYPLILMNDNRE